MSLERGRLLADDSVTGSRWCRAHSDLVDRWLGELLTTAAGDRLEGIALVAVGGYGRSELCPQSDIDVYLIHDRRDVAAIADRIWYPIWDSSLHLGHSVCTVPQALQLAGDDLDTATALLNARHIGGDESLTIELAKAAGALWERKAKRWLGELSARVTLRHEKVGEVAFALEPDLKEGRGGLRDAHGLAWAEAAHRVLLDHDETAISHAYAVLLDARVELQRVTARPSNVLALQEQDEVAAALGLPDADALMSRVAEAAQTIAWTSDDAWRRIRSFLRGPLGRVTRRNRSIDPEIHLRDGEVEVTDTARLDDPLLVLRVAVAAAANRTVIERHTLERLAAARVSIDEPWDRETRRLFLDLLLRGAPAVSVIEALDQRGLWARLVPEWASVRARPQRNPYHRFTVDRHLLETVAGAARLAGRVRRPDLLVLAALLHDLGKGRDGDHTEQGTAIASSVTTRLGLTPDDANTVVGLVARHLLLADEATRRDISDPTTIERVAGLVGSPEELELLAALTEADAIATGPSAWSPWRAELVAQLVDRVSLVVAGAGPAPGPSDAFPTDAQLEDLARGEELIAVDGDVLTVMTADRPGVFSRIAGVLALHGVDVVMAAAYSSDAGRALSEFRVHSLGRTETPWDRVTRDLRLALDGRLALSARLSERARTYERRAPRPRSPSTTQVRFDAHASADATVIDVQTADAIGVLYRITRALAELDLDIRAARVQTLGPTVVDAFYVRAADGRKVTDEELVVEIERAILHSLAT